jgi:membrane protease YdiL (CAAX protease family)
VGRIDRERITRVAKKRAKAARAKPSDGEPASRETEGENPRETSGVAARAERVVPVWRSSFLFFALFHFAAAVALWITMHDDPSTFGWVCMAYLIGAGLVITGVGVQRMRAPNPRPNKLDQLHPKEFFYETWRDLDAEARAERAAKKKKGGYSWGPLVALTFGAVCLTIMEYAGSASRNNLFTMDGVLEWFAAGHPDGVKSWLDLSAADIETIRDRLRRWGGDTSDLGVLMQAIRDWPWYSLTTKAWWAGWRVIGYFLMPAILIWSTRGRLRDNGLETKGFREHAWIYAFGYYVVFLCVVIVSHTHEFSTYYPFYRPYAHRSWFDFFSWELLYAAQFFSLEFFFRGWWLKSMKPAMGSYAIFAMVVPYCMIHYGKPFAETMGAILAGVFLGTLAMKTRSIWSGFLIHVSVAVSMDVAALLQDVGLPKVWFPDVP